MSTNEKLKSFLSSTALVIDDEIIDTNSTISKIVLELENHGTLFVKRRDLPDILESLSNISFIILDWDLTKKEEEDLLPIGVSLGEALLASKKDEIIRFIKNIVTNYFIPIFIFSREDAERIKNCLVGDEQLKNAIEKSKIFICNKNSLQNGLVINSLDDWLNNSMTVYTFKIMEEAIEKAKHRFFNEMFECDPNWPCHVYQTLQKDNPVDINSDFQEFLMTSYVSTIESIQFDSQGFNKEVRLGDVEILKIYNKIKFFEYQKGWNIGPHSGDIYVAENNNDEEYYINISASCDMRGKQYYFVKGNTKNIEEDKICTYVVYKLLNKSAICFDLRKVKIFKRPSNINILSTGDNSNKKIFNRIGRLLPPYINALQEKYAHFVTRTGVLREPD